MARRRAEGDPLLRGRLHLRQHGTGVELVTGEGVFSAASVDPGTAFLLRWLADAPGARVLDVGCGYGPLGLWLAAARPERTVVAVDRDAVALECTHAGAERSGVADRVVAHGSLGYDDVAPGARFDLVVSNVPAKVGGEALRHLLLDAWHHLDPDGLVAVVVVDRLAAPVGELLDAEAAVTVEERHANRGYTCWTYGFTGEPAGADPRPGFDRGVYRRATAAFAVGRSSWAATTSTTIAEFDTLAHATVAAVELLQGAPLPGPVAVVGAGQGHLALALRAVAGAATAIRLVDRDLLALRTAKANLVEGVELAHTARPAGSVAGCRSAIVALSDKQPVSVSAALLAPALAELAPGSPVVLHGRPADVSRVLDLLRSRGSRLTVVDRNARGTGSAAFTVTPPA